MKKMISLLLVFLILGSVAAYAAPVKNETYFKDLGMTVQNPSGWKCYDSVQSVTNDKDLTQKQKEDVSSLMIQSSGFYYLAVNYELADLIIITAEKSTLPDMNTWGKEEFDYFISMHKLFNNNIKDTEIVTSNKQNIKMVKESFGISEKEIAAIQYFITHDFYTIIVQFSSTDDYINKTEEAIIDNFVNDLYFDN